MKLLRRAALPVMTLIIPLILAGCGGGPSAKDVMARVGTLNQPGAVTKAEVRFLKDSKGSNYKYVDLTADTALLNQLLGAISACAEAKKPQGAQYSPELMGDCEIVLTGKDGAQVSFYYVFQGNLLIYPDWQKSGEKNTVRYLYFAAGDQLGSLLTAQQQAAQLTQEDAVKPFRSLEELKSSIDEEELAEEGTELNFEFYTDATPENAGTACRIYSSADLPSLPADSVLVTAYGKTKTGEQQKLSVMGLEANTNYTKILVSEPDEALEVDTGDASPDSFAILIKKGDLDPNKWIVFVDSDNQILDVIVPEGIEGLGEGQPASEDPGSGDGEAPEGGASPDGTAPAGPTASADDAGSGD